MASGTLGGFVMALPLGLLSDRFDRRLIIIGAAITAAMTLLAIITLVPRGAVPWLQYLCVAPFGGTFMPTYSIVIAYVNDSMPEVEFVAAAGNLLIVQGAGAAVTPPTSLTFPRPCFQDTLSIRPRQSAASLAD